MKKLMQIGLLSAGLAGFGLAASAAEPKIATFNFQKAYDAYYKSIQSALAIRRDVAEVKKEESERVDIAKKHDEEYRQLIDKANDQAISAEQREKSKRLADDKRAELEVDKQSFTEFEQRAKSHIQMEEERRTSDIIKEIRGVVDAHAKSGGYSMVLDSSGESTYHVPVLLYSAGQDDLTDSIIKELNAAAPPGSLDTNALAAPISNTFSSNPLAAPATNKLIVPGSSIK
jgi:Skp family chaperone for outer membrane proteins